MPRPAQRSRSFIKKRVNTPGGRANIHYLKKKPSRATCGVCRKLLHGVPSDLPAAIRKLPRNRKRPDRPYGGTLCSACSRDVMKRKNMDRWDNA